MRQTFLITVLLVAAALPGLTAASGGNPTDPNGWPTVPYDANDFAIEVVRYDIGEDIRQWPAPYDARYGYYDNPQVALGRPSLYTTMDTTGGIEPVNPAYSPWRANQVVSIGNTYDPQEEVALVLKFDPPVMNHPRNPFGIDFIVFGVSRFTINTSSGGRYWQSGMNPEDVTITNFYHEPAIVSVSQDGLTWYSFNGQHDPRADSFAPTGGFNWDRVKQQWGEPLDPTYPIDPNLKAADFIGKTLGQAIEMYNGSAGGAGFDIGVFGLEWVQYVKISDDSSLYGPSEVDAVARVRPLTCGHRLYPCPPGDLNEDCRVNFGDFAVYAGESDYGLESLIAIVENWLACTWECD